MMEDCTVPFEALVGFQDGHASSRLIGEIRAHLQAGCAACSNRLAWLARAIAVMRGSEEGLHVSAQGLRQAGELFRKRQGAGTGPLEIIRAALVLDSRRSPALAGSRGDQTAEYRNL